MNNEEMTNEEAILRIKDHMLIHKLTEPRAVYITQALNLAIKAIRIVGLIENGFKRDSNLIMDSDDWKDIKALVEKGAKNDRS